jgi:DNA polymerase II small subunit
VVCIEAVKAKGGLFVAENILLPDIPDRPLKSGCGDELYAVIFSDTHMGSKKFLEDVFDHAVEWLNGRAGLPNQRRVADRVKYVVIPGDLVDGVGVYPKQERELEISDIYEQYKYAARFIERFPDYVKVILIPGNHDAVRQALPQPAIPRDFAEPVYEAHEVVSLGNPSIISLHGVQFLLHHGRSLEDMISTSPQLSFQRPQDAMRLQLRCRHLAPAFGSRTAIAPLPVDWLVIDEVPHVFVSGHVHIFGHEYYRGTMILNAGTWQSQTSYQVEMGLEPTPGILPVVNLQTLKLNVSSFMPTSVAA